MKKSLLLSAAVMFAATGFAQSAQVSVDKNVKMSLPKSLKMETEFKANAKKGPARSLATGTYFQHPEGTFYVGWGLNGYGSILTQLAAPMNTNITFKNLSSAASFKRANQTVSAAGKDYILNEPYGFAQFAPVLINQKDSFCVGSNNIYSIGLRDGDSRFSSYSKLQYALNWGFVGPVEESVLYPVDDHGGEYFNNRLYTNTASLAGFTSENYLFGSGNIVSENKVVGTITGISQYFGKTAAPLTVKAVSFKGFSKTKPLAEGTTLTAYICRASDNAFSDETKFKEADVNNIIATLTCTSSDTVDFSNPEQIGSYFKAAEGTLRFTNKVEDEFGNVSEEPVVIPAGTDFCIYVAGLEQSGVDFGGFGFNLPAEESQGTDMNYNGLIYYTKASDASQVGITATQNTTAAQIGIVGLYDGACAPEVPYYYTFENTSLKYNVVRLTGSGDETVTLTDGATGNGMQVQGADGYPCAPFFTVQPFFNTDETTGEVESANYDIQTSATWLKASVAEISGENKFYGLVFKADPLPEGVTGRQAEVKIISADDNGSVESNTIYVLQGDATLGIDNISAETKTSNNGLMFNIAGQQVAKSFKGLVINNGKKFFNK